MSRNIVNAPKPGLGRRILNLFARPHRKPYAQNYGAPGTTTDTLSTAYGGMNEDYRYYRRNELVRRCINANAFFTTMSGGFETRLQGLSQSTDLSSYAMVKEKIDEINRKVNMDLVLYQAQIKRSVFGWSAHEILSDPRTGLPVKMLPLDSTKIRPDIDVNWRLTGYTYEGRRGQYKPDDILWFRNIPLEGDHLGLSDIEPIRITCSARYNLLKENFPEIIKSIWAPYVILAADTGGLGKDEANSIVDNLALIARSGKSTAINESITAHVIDNTPNLDGLVKLLDKLDMTIISSLGVPRFVLSIPGQNRATSFAELEAYSQGTILHKQRDLRRQLEPYYQLWASRILKNTLPGSFNDQMQMPVRVKHIWRPVRVIDFYEMAKSVSALWSKGDGVLGRHPEEAWELLNLDVEDMKRQLEINRNEVEPVDQVVQEEPEGEEPIVAK